MTREEIKNTPELVDFLLDKSLIADSRMKLHKRLEIICNLAIEELEQEPCEDAISRQAVLKIIDGWYDNNRDTENIEDLIVLITYMGSVNPQKPICPSEGVDPAYEKTLNKWIGAEVLDRIRNEMHATAEMHEDGVYYLRDEWVDEIIDKYAEGSDKE